MGYSGRWKAKRPSKIAVVAAGYGDGYDRHAVDGTPVLVNGQRCPIAGKVSMDMLTVDVTDVPDAAIGSEVVLWELLAMAVCCRWTRWPATAIPSAIRC